MSANLSRKDMDCDEAVDTLSDSSQPLGRDGGPRLSDSVGAVLCPLQSVVWTALLCHVRSKLREIVPNPSTRLEPASKLRTRPDPSRLLRPTL